MDLLFIAPQEEGQDGTVENITNVENNAATANDQTLNTEATTEQPASEPVAEPQGNPWSFWLMIGAMILIMYFFMWRPERKRRKQMEQFRKGLKKGDKVITAGGIYGTIKEVKDAYVLIDVDGNVSLRVDKGMVVGDPSNGTAR